MDARRSSMKKSKNCKEGKIINPITGRCVLPCDPDETMNMSTGKCEKTEKKPRGRPALRSSEKARRATKRATMKRPSSLKNAWSPLVPVNGKNCKEGKIINPVTGRCVLPCDPDETMNMSTGKCEKTEKKPRGRPALRSSEKARRATKRATMVQRQSSLSALRQTLAKENVMTIAQKHPSLEKYRRHSPVPTPAQVYGKNCKEGKIINPVTGRCVLPCDPDETMNMSTGKCEKTEKKPRGRPALRSSEKARRATERVASLPSPSNILGRIEALGNKKCKEGKVMNPITQRCVLPCKPDEIINPLTGKCERVKAEKLPKGEYEKVCKEGKVMNPVTNRCVLPCKPGLVIDMVTGKCVPPPEPEEPVVPLPDARSEEFQIFLQNILKKPIKSVERQYPFTRLAHKLSGKSIIEHLEKISDLDARIDACKDTGIYEIQPHQSIVYMMARLKAEGRIDTPGLLAVHSTGAGKTLIALSTFLAFWHSRNPATGQLYPLFFISTKGNQDANSLNKLAELGINFFPDFVDNTGSSPREIFAIHKMPELASRIAELKAQGRSPALDKQCQDVCVKFLKERLFRGMETIYKPEYMEEIRSLSRDNLLTFGKFANDVSKNVFNLNENGQIANALFVMDEVQFLMAPPESEMFMAKQYAALRSFLQTGRDPKSTWILAMSATPGETREQVSGIINIVASDPELITPADFDTPATVVRKLRGLVSYANLVGDYSHFAKMEIVPQCIVLPEESVYHRMYNKAISNFFNDKERLGREGQYRGEARHLFYNRLREAGNFIERAMNRKSKKQGSDDEEDYEEFDEGEAEGSFELTIDTKDGRGDYKIYVSPKLIALLVNIRKNKGKHYVYTSSTRTALIIAYLMERYLNIKRLPIDCVVEEAPENEPKPAFGVAHKATCQVKANPGQEYFIMLDDIKTKKENLRNYAYENVPQTRIDTGKAFANLMDNYHGDQVKVILATKENFKGVDMNHLRYLHLVDPLVDFQDFIQFMGRGPRFCSHRKYTIAKRNVELMLYRVVAGDNCPKNERARALLADCHVFDNSLRRYEYNWAIIEKALQEASVDYLVFRDNIHRNNEIIQQRIMDLKCAVVESAKELIPKMGKEFVEEHRARRDAEMAEEKAKADELKRQQQELFGRQRIGRAERAAMRDARRQ